MYTKKERLIIHQLFIIRLLVKGSKLHEVFRHRLVHDYEDTNWSIICDIIFDVLPEFQKQLGEL